MSNVQRRLNELEQALSPKPEQDPFIDFMCNKMIEIIYDDTLSEEEADRLLDELEIPEPTTDRGREMRANFLKAYGSDASHEGK